MSWIDVIERWRALPKDEKARLRRSRIALNVAESMSFEGEPVDAVMLEAELARMEAQPVSSGVVPAS